ncbi:DNA polymerase I [Thermoactinomyces sp. DSM 45892]|uniref:DNA polymerase I n=1 Tax=Thermoactinomyces sp. DSM 45892 TaxID=1882753 RepID=UPI00089AE753|nr:DNA polymerase I [Thermoactinomyces sp. DSM 45892]SDZ12670.1 DNA polymerase I [Thermoactinomyces sp. DSM 45892]
MSKKKIVLIDGNSIAFRAFYALPLLTNSSGLYTNAAYGFAMMLLKVLEEEKPTHMLVAFDEGKDTFRHEFYQEYKGKRDKTPGELTGQFPLIKEVLDACQIRYYGIPGYEADDIIGTLSKMADAEEMETLIVSGDKDLFQLVTDRVSVLMTRKGVTEADRYTPESIQERYGLTPSQIIDLKGLMGDPSDNIPGIPGVGEKTGLKLLHQHGSVEEIIAHVNDLPGKKLQEKVTEFQEQALLSKRLATICCEVPLDFNIDDLEHTSIHTEEVVETFKKLEFKTLVDRIQKGFGESLGQASGPDQTLIEYQIVSEDSTGDWNDLLQSDSLALHIESSEENPHRSELIGLSLSDGTTNLYIPANVVTKWKKLRDWLGSSNSQKIVFDGKRSEIALSKLGISLEGIEIDILLAAYLLNPSEASLNLSDVAAQHSKFGLASDEEVYGKGAKRKLPTEETLAQHIAQKAYVLYDLQSQLKPEIERTDLANLLYHLEMPLSRVLGKMEKRGVKVDGERLEQLGSVLRETLERLTVEIYDTAGTDFNINSPKQLGEILFDKLGLPVLKKTKTGYSTSADVLEKLAPQHEIVDKILHYRQVGKLLSTYVEGLKKEISADGKIHTHFNQTIAATGRLSSVEPNLQNIPIRLEEGRKIRQIFVPSEENWMILAADYSQVELRVLAHISGDPSLQKAFRDSKDIHTQTAMDVFQVEEGEVTSLMRRQAKAVNFGIVYGISPFGLSQNLNIPQKEAKQFIERYFETYPGVKTYMDKIVAQAKQDGYVTTLLQRRRYLPELYATDFARRSFAERTAMNTPIQGTAADIIKKAMVDIDRLMVEKKMKSRMLLQVHDELIFEVPTEELGSMGDLVRETMEQAIELSVPLEVDLNIGQSWYEAK